MSKTQYIFFMLGFNNNKFATHTVRKIITKFHTIIAYIFVRFPFDV